MPEITFVSQGERERRATESKKVLEMRNHINHAKSKKYSKIWNYHIFAKPKNGIKEQGVSYVSIDLQRDVTDLDCVVKPQKIPLLGCEKVRSISQIWNLVTWKGMIIYMQR